MSISDDISGKFKHSYANERGKELPPLVWKRLPASSAQRQGFEAGAQFHHKPLLAPVIPLPGNFGNKQTHPTALPLY